MEELQKIKIRMQVENQYGDKFEIYQEVDEEFSPDDGELGIYHNAYMSFLKTAGFCFNLEDRVIVLKEDEYVETYCDSDCDCCDECDDDNEYYDVDDFVDMVADEVIDKINNARCNTGFKTPIRV